MPEMQGWFDIHKSANKIHHTNGSNEKSSEKAIKMSAKVRMTRAKYLMLFWRYQHLDKENKEEVWILEKQ